MAEHDPAKLRPQPPLLHSYEHICQAIGDAISDVVYVKDLAGRYIFVNQAGSRWIERPAADVVGLDDSAFRHPYRARVVGDIERRVMNSGTVDTTQEAEIVAGMSRIFAWTRSPFRDPNGDTIGVIGVGRDVTDQARAENVLTAEASGRRSEYHIRLVLDSLPVGVAVLNVDGDVILNNLASHRIWGECIRPGAERYQTSRGWWHANGKPIAADEWASRRAISKGETSVNEVIDIESFDGVRRTILNSAAPICDSESGISGAVVINEDVTERIALEAQLRQSQKMEAIGHLAGGVAHDFNNLLTVVTGYTEMLLNRPTQSDADREWIGEIQHAAERAAALTQQLLIFSRKADAVPKILDVNEIIRDHEKMLRRLIGEDIALEVVLDPSLRPVRVDAGHLSQVMVNLAVNARDAMPTGGSLKITSRQVEIGEMDGRAEAVAGQYARIEVRDSGSGMSREVQARVFEPFFTTKPSGMGTGLGLATVYGIVRQTGGFIDLESHPGKGTRFHIFLPTVQETAQVAVSVAARTPSRGNETILLVEDDSAVRSFMRKALEASGYIVLEANGPTAALQICESHEGVLDLLMTDVVMPEMGGRALVDRIDAMRPGLKVIYLSGYTEDAVLRHGVHHADVSFLQKPFTMARLAEKVRQVLDAPGE